MSKTIEEVNNANKELSFEERAKKFNEGVRKLAEEYGCIPWAGFTQTAESPFTAVPLVKDLWPKEEEKPAA